MFVEGSHPSLLHAYPAAGRQEWKTVLVACMFSKQHYSGSNILHYRKQFSQILPFIAQAKNIDVWESIANIATELNNENFNYLRLF
jgi:hypothetical protein